MVTHDPKAAAIADRILFLSDGQIVKDLAGADENEIVDAMKGSVAPCCAWRSGGSPRGGCAPRSPRWRSSSGSRWWRAPSCSPTRSRAPFGSIFQTIYQGTDATVTGRNAIDSKATGGAGANGDVPPFTAVPAAAGPAPLGGQGGHRRRVGQPPGRRQRQGHHLRRRARTSASASTRPSPSSARSSSSAATGRARRASSSTPTPRARSICTPARRSASRAWARSCG